MKKQLLSLGTLMLALLLTNCATVYNSPEISSRIAAHKTVAILPFTAVIQSEKLARNVSSEEVKTIEQEMGFVFQEQMYTRFLDKSDKYNIEFQDIAKTNVLLKRKGINASTMNDFTKEEIAKILKVDAVVSGKIVTSQPLTTREALAIKRATGETAASNTININISLHDGMDSKLLYKYDQTYSGDLQTTPETLTQLLMGNVSRNFPYRKK